MKKVIIHVELGKGNFAAYVEKLPGCTTTGKTPDELEKNMREAIDAHVELTLEYGEKVPSVFLSKYELVFKYEPDALFAQYAPVFNKAALGRLTGINERQLWFYAAGKKKPRLAQKQKITAALHKLGRELQAIEL